MKDVLLVVPTLGLRVNELTHALGSALDSPLNIKVEIRSPNVDLKEFVERWNDPRLLFCLDESSQSQSILNSWRDNPGFKAYSWLNDDDWLTAGFRTACLMAIKSATDSRPTVTFGHLLIDSSVNFRFIKTPRKITLLRLAAGANYVPGLGTLLNQPAVKVLSEKFEVDSYRDAFDLAWWLLLAREDAAFNHTGLASAAWRDHPLARTQSEPERVSDETRQLKDSFYRGTKFHWVPIEIVSTIVRGMARLSTVFCKARH
jgi:hypothetical protein